MWVRLGGIRGNGRLLGKKFSFWLRKNLLHVHVATAAQFLAMNLKNTRV